MKFYIDFNRVTWTTRPMLTNGSTNGPSLYTQSLGRWTGSYNHLPVHKESSDISSCTYYCSLRRPLSTNRAVSVWSKLRRSKSSGNPRKSTYIPGLLCGSSFWLKIWLIYNLQSKCISPDNERKRKLILDRRKGRSSNINSSNDQSAAQTTEVLCG